VICFVIQMNVDNSSPLTKNRNLTNSVVSEVLLVSI